MLIWAEGATVYIGEDRVNTSYLSAKYMHMTAQENANLWNVLNKNKSQGREKIAEARQDVKDCVAGGLPEMAYGEVPYIFAHAAAGSKVQLGLIMANGEVLAFPCPP